MLNINTNLEAFFTVSDKNTQSPNIITNNILKQNIPTEIDSSNYSHYNNIDFIYGGRDYMKHALDDTKRITDFLSSPKGNLWILKQEGLHLMNPKRGYDGIDPINIFNPIKFSMNIPQGGFHIDNYGSMHHEVEYEKFYNKLNTTETYKTGNRLIKMLNNFGLTNDENTLQSSSFERILSLLTDDMQNSKLIKTLKNINERFEETINTELTGVGGPNSFYGIGSTVIRKSVSGIPITLNSSYNPNNPYNNTIDKTNNSSGLTKLQNELYGKRLQPGFATGYNGMSIDLLDNYNTYQSYKEFQTDNSPYSKKYNNFDTELNSKTKDYFKDITGYKDKFNFNDNNSYYQNWNMSKRLGTADNSYPNEGTHVSGTDEINMGSNNSNDLIHLKIAGIQFRAFISGLSDTFSPSWSPTKYIGRPDDVYTYEGTKRALSFNLLVPLFSVHEIETVYTKLDKLVQLQSPKISDSGQMSGQIISLKIGMWFANNVSEGLPVIMTSLSYTIDDEYPWDIIKEIPMVVNISLGFDVIDNYSPSSTKKHFRGTSE